MKLHRNKVLSLCEERDMTLKELAEKMDIEQTKFSKYLHGSNVPKGRIQDIADYFDVPLLEIVKITGFDY